MFEELAEQRYLQMKTDRSKVVNILKQSSFLLVELEGVENMQNQ
jgi:hypothetical protein